ncbi:MAG: hypothetical protein LBG24_11410 [Treponema sp.]|jgi:hypothetical protein|nr:hypothetical protein [Treponema sp.]
MPWYVGLVCSVLLFSCAGSPDSQVSPYVDVDQDFWNLLPVNGENSELIFIGVAGVRMNRQEAIDLALEDAARRVAFFQRVAGEVLHRVEIGTGFLDYRSEHQAALHYDAEGYGTYREALEFDPEQDVRIEHQAVFVRTRYRASRSLPVKHRYAVKNERPQWVDNPPKQISGFWVGVGFAGPRLYHKDTVIASYENAVFSIIESISNTVSSKVESVQDSGGAFSAFSVVNSNEVRASGTLGGFYVLETWTDPATKAVWTLAIAEAP